MAAMRVLLAEDDETKAVQTQSMLREAEDTEVVVDWVSSSTEALRHTTRGGYDAYLIDVTLGEASGLDVAEAGDRGRLPRADRAARRVRRGRPGHRGAAPRRRRLPRQGRDHRAAAAARRHATPSSAPASSRALARERGPPAAGRAHREPRPPRRRHRPRLQQPAHRHPRLHDHARAADRSRTIRRASRSTRSAGPRSWRRGWRGSCWPTAGGSRSSRPRSTQPGGRGAGRDARAAGRRSPDVRRGDDAGRCRWSSPIDRRWSRW